MPAISTERWSRRRVLASMTGLAGALVAADLALPFWHTPEIARADPVPLDRVQIGANFSPVECWYTDMNAEKTFETAMSLNLDFVRLGAYWNQIEPRPGEFDFAALDPLIERADRAGTKVILTIGIKTPVYPEFHFPEWVIESGVLPPTGLITRSDQLREWGHRFARRVAEHYATTSAISILQVENEPFEPIVPAQYWSLDEQFLRGQVEIVRSADRLGRPILITAFVGSHRITNGLQGMLRRPAGRMLFDPILGSRPDEAIIELADLVGLDVYPGLGWSVFGLPVYLHGSRDDDAALLAFRDRVVAAGKRSIIAECQAKPWEPGEKVYRSADEAPSFRATDIAPLVGRLAGYGFDTITLWGIEHWIYHRESGNPSWWNEGSRLLAQRQAGR